MTASTPQRAQAVHLLRGAGLLPVDDQVELPDVELDPVAGDAWDIGVHQAGALRALMALDEAGLIDLPVGEDDGLRMESGVSVFDGAPYVAIFLGPRQIGQVSPPEARRHALMTLQAAEAASNDAALYAAIVDGNRGTPEELAHAEATVGAILAAVRDWRDRVEADELTTDGAGQAYATVTGQVERALTVLRSAEDAPDARSARQAIAQAVSLLAGL